MLLVRINGLSEFVDKAYEFKVIDADHLYNILISKHILFGMEGASVPLFHYIDIYSGAAPMEKKQLALAALAVLGFAVAGIASAAPVTMTFDELGVGNLAVTNGQFVADFYNGGCGSSFTGPSGNVGPVTCNGPDYGVAWTGAAVARGGGATGTTMPSPPNVLVRGSPNNLAGPLPTMNVANGFEADGFSFWYSTTGPTAIVTVYSGLDGGGDALFTTNALPSLPAKGCGVFVGFGCWSQIAGITFDGIAHSVVFGGAANTVAWDNISFNTMAPQPPTGVPEPGVLGMFGFGALLIGGGAVLARRRRAGEA